MKSKHLLFLTLSVIILSILISACGGRVFIPSGWAGITVVGENVYMANNQFVYAIRLADGQQIWRFPEKANSKQTFYAAPVMTPSGQLLVGSYDHSLYSLNPETGQLNWSFPTKNRIVGSPLATEKGIFLPSSDVHLYAIDYNGKELWKYKARGPLWSQPVADPACECIYLSSVDHYLYALNADNGNLLWERDMKTSILSSPTLFEDTKLYLTTLGGDVNAIMAKENRLIWQENVGQQLWASPALEGDLLYTGDQSNTLYALQASDGTTKWKFEADGAIVGTPAVTPTGVYFTTEAGTVYGLDRDGAVILQKNLDTDKSKAKIYAGPVVVGEGVAPSGLILVSPEGLDYLLVALQPDGAQKWAFIPPK